MTMGNDPRHRGEIRASVIVPAYNAQPTIQRAITSALMQTEPRCEVVVIDDASRDGTAAIVAGIAEHDSRVCLLRNPTNLGPAASRNRGLAVARGDWVALLDADDEFLPHRIETLIALGERHAADVVADNLLLCPDDNTESSEPMISPRALPTGRLLTAAAFVAGNVGSRSTPRVSYGFLQPIIRRDFLQKHDLRYDERNRFGEDFLLYIACLLKGVRWWITPEAMYRYRVRSGSSTDVQSAADLQRIRLMEQALLYDEALVASDPELVRALRRHKRVIDRFYHYRAFTDALKARATASAFHLLFESASSFRQILLESALRAPTIMMKALRGGYRRNRRSTSPLPAGTGAERN
jgi:succinoglycan biosynthesis protein ExoO/succinoglycan biosynthesis protein ExoU